MGLKATFALVVGLAVGCTTNNPPSGGRDGDPALFESTVQPIIQRQCGFEACHGREGMPLTLYAVDYLRLRDPTGVVDPDAPPLNERSLTDTELEHNRRALAARTSPGDPTGEAVILRLLPISEGGIPHGDTVLYDNRHHPDVQAISRFLGTVREAD